MLLNAYLHFRMEMNSGSVLGYLLQSLPIACLAGIVFFAVRFAVLKKRHAPIHWPSEMLRVLFACYLAGLISLIVLPANFWLAVYDGIFLGFWDEMGPVFQFGGVNLVPSAVKCLKGELVLGSWVKQMLIGNTAMFVPFGFFLPILTRIRRVKGIALAAAVVPLCFESAQLFFGRSLDVDDLICNAIGIVIGAMIAHVILRAKSAALNRTALRRRT